MNLNEIWHEYVRETYNFAMFVGQHERYLVQIRFVIKISRPVSKALTQCRNSTGSYYACYALQSRANCSRIIT